MSTVGAAKDLLVFTHAGGSPSHGPNLRWYHLGREHVRAGGRVTLVCASWFHKYVVAPTARRECIDGVDYVRIATNRYRGLVGRLLNQCLYTLGALLLVLRGWRSLRADVVIASSPHPFAVFPAALAARRMGVPLVFEIRDLWPAVIRELSGAARWNPYVLLLGWTEAFAVRHADLVVSVKPGDLDYLSAVHGLDASRFLHVPNGLSTDAPVPAPPVATGPEAELTVGYIGAMSAYYGLDELIDAARLLDAQGGFRFVLVGGGEDRDRLVERARGLSSVEFPGRVAPTEARARLGGFDVCYVGLKDVPSNRHGISCNKLFEYFWAGRPVLASYRTDHDPVADAACGVTVPPGRPEAIADALRRLRADPQARAAMGARARAAFLGGHDFAVLQRVYGEALARLLEASR